jgi:hypothetical protein
MLLFLFALATPAFGDVYLHNPRGSNNRLNEANAVRNNGNRLFDSQNNNRGGYNAGDKYNTAADATDFMYEDIDTLYDTATTPTGTAKQYQMGFFEFSDLLVEWTNQHACGGSEASDPQKVNCNIVMQYMCDVDHTDLAMKVRLRNGGNTNTPTEPNSYAQVVADQEPKNGNDATTGRMESKGWYYECKKRDRNKGLFLADQKLKGNTARYTRQNPNGNRRGLECPEERDYFPYWSPSPWIDAGYLTDHTEHCPMVLAGSQNTKTTYKCTGRVENDQTAPITQEACEALPAPAAWTAYPGKGVGAMECTQAPWSRTNHLGNSVDGEASRWKWQLPSWAVLENYKAKSYGSTIQGKRCVFRLRYNISTDDYDPWNTDVRNNSILENNPVVDVGTVPRQGLRLAINTNQFGRTFQDRSHVFYILKRTGITLSKRVVNLNVRGKRGNIVQTFPSVEYDFIPNKLVINSVDLLHVQWTGSNTHNNGGGGGDGQAGDDGQGQRGTDRNNLVAITDFASNYPIPVDKTQFDSINLVKRSTCFNLNGVTISDWVDCAVILATSGYARTKSADFSDFSPQMNNAPPSLIGGVLMSVGRGTYNYISSRNNNFSNRGQKGYVIVN